MNQSFLEIQFAQKGGCTFILSYLVVLEVPRMEGWNHSYMILKMRWWDDRAFTPKSSACMKGFTVSSCGVLIVKATAMFCHHLKKSPFLVIRQFHIMSNGYHIKLLNHVFGFASISADICFKKMQLQMSRHNWIPVQTSPNPFSCEHKEPLRSVLTKWEGWDRTASSQLPTEAWCIGEKVHL